MSKVLYRYEIRYYNYDDVTDVVLREYPVIGETPKTYVIDVYGKNKRVLKDAFSTFAFDTKEDAIEHFKRRTKNRIRWYEFWIDECQKGLEIIDSKDGNSND